MREMMWQDCQNLVTASAFKCKQCLVTCLQCGKPIPKQNTKFCSRSCATTSRNLRRTYKRPAKSHSLRERFFQIDIEKYTLDEIAEQLGVAKITVSRIIREYGIKKKAPYKGIPSPLDADPAIKKWLIENGDNHSIIDIAARFNVDRITAGKWRKKLGLRSGHIGKWSKSKHPKGFTDGKHTPDALAKMSAASRRAWADPNSMFWSEEAVQRRSDQMCRNMHNGVIKKENVHSRSKAGYRDDLGKIFFRSIWEANYARYLNILKDHGEILKWEYEPDTFWFHEIKRGVRSYKPDFKIWEADGSDPYYVEVKGWMDPKSKTKLKRMAKYYPDTEIKVVGAKEYYGIRRSVGPLIPNWEHKPSA